jgi:hypothetical protein
VIFSQTTPQPCLQADAGRVLPVFENFPLAQSEFGVAAAMGLDVIDASCGHDAASGKAQGTSGTVVVGATDAVAVSTNCFCHTTYATANSEPIVGV